GGSLPARVPPHPRAPLVLGDGTHARACRRGHAATGRAPGRRRRDPLPGHHVAAYQHGRRGRVRARPGARRARARRRRRGQAARPARRGGRALRRRRRAPGGRGLPGARDRLRRPPAHPRRLPGRGQGLEGLRDVPGVPALRAAGGRGAADEARRRRDRLPRLTGGGGRERDPALRLVGRPPRPRKLRQARRAAPATHRRGRARARRARHLHGDRRGAPARRGRDPRQRRRQRRLAHAAATGAAAAARQGPAGQPRPGRHARAARRVAGRGGPGPDRWPGRTARLQPRPRHVPGHRPRRGGRGRRPRQGLRAAARRPRGGDGVSASPSPARRVEDLVREAQASIVARFEALDGGARFRPHAWDRAGGGGGTAMVLEGGDTFAKVGINVSAVHGTEVPASLAAAHPEAAGKPFFATGLSLIAHAVNPYVPSFHANYRYFEVGDLWWFGGGADLTPNYAFDEDVTHFHGVLKAQCDARDPALYDELKRRCDEYFYLPHRRETRGVGGIFFDQLTPPREAAAAGAAGVPGGPLWEADLAFAASGLRAIPEAYLPLVARRRGTPYGERELAWQRLRRGR